MKKNYYIKWSRECYIRASSEGEARKLFAEEANEDEFIEVIKEVKLGEAHAAIVKEAQRLNKAIKKSVANMSIVSGKCICK
jgi:hypothetical protein